jgi:CheY-like chemotaxis protein
VPTGSLEGVTILHRPTGVEHDANYHVWQPTPEALRGARILLVEDGYDNRELIRLILQKAGAEVECVEDGSLAVDRVERERESFDLILMDMNMPVMDGYEATRLLRERGYEKPIFALTANAMADDIKRCLAAGCDEYLAKPIVRAKLIGAIAACVDRQRIGHA